MVNALLNGLFNGLSPMSSRLHARFPCPDFFDYQITLLETFPREPAQAGREGKHPRIVPFMPCHADEVNDALSTTWQQELNDYLGRLCYLNRITALYILEQ